MSEANPSSPQLEFDFTPAPLVSITEPSTHSLDLDSFIGFDELPFSVFFDKEVSDEKIVKVITAIRMARYRVMTAIFGETFLDGLQSEFIAQRAIIIPPDLVGQLMGELRRDLEKLKLDVLINATHRTLEVVPRYKSDPSFKWPVLAAGFGELPSISLPALESIDGSSTTRSAAHSPATPSTSRAYLENDGRSPFDYTGQGWDPDNKTYV